MKNNNYINKKCTHCGSLDTLPIRYGLMTEESQKDNASNQQWVWGGCVIYQDDDTDYCKGCKNTFGGLPSSKEQIKLKQQESENFIKDREKLIGILDKYLDEEKDQEMYAQALKEAEGDEEEAEHIYFDLFISSQRDNE